MTGLLTLSGNPSTALQAAQKQDVDPEATVTAGEKGALPMNLNNEIARATAAEGTKVNKAGDTMTGLLILSADPGVALGRSEERRVGKEGRSRWSPYH